MSPAGTAQQTAAANQARRQRTEEKLRRVADAIGQLQRRRLPVTYPAIAARALFTEQGREFQQFNG
jgi:hypothetical protein